MAMSETSRHKRQAVPAAPIAHRIGDRYVGCGWRLDSDQHKDTWSSGTGARLYGARWNSVGQPAVYCALDAATAILEVAVHKTFRSLDIVAHTLTRFELRDDASIHRVDVDAVPNPNWLRPGAVSAGQQAFGDQLLKTHGAFFVQSVISKHSWNLIFDPDAFERIGTNVTQERFALDTRLVPPASA
jgi:RES domain-containing protein